MEVNVQLKTHLCLSAVLLVIVFCVNAHAQQDQPPAYVVHPNQEVRIAVPSVVADSTSDVDVIAASVATAVLDGAVCCDRNSALADQVGSITKFSLKELREKLGGKHYLQSGSSIVITDQYWPGSSVNVGEIVGSLLTEHPLLMVWDGHLYVVYGALYDEYVSDSGIMFSIRKLWLVDTRFSDKRRDLTFDRQTDDWNKVSGLLKLAITR
jgi:hypothetical protein